EVEVFAIHARKFSFQNHLVLVLIDVNAGTPRAASDTFFIKCARHAAGEKSVDFVLKSSQVAERVITNDTHFSNPPKFLPVYSLKRLFTPERNRIINTECVIVKAP